MKTEVMRQFLSTYYAPEIAVIARETKLNKTGTLPIRNPQSSGDI